MGNLLNNLARTGWTVHNVEKGANALGGGFFGYGLLCVLAKKENKRPETSKSSSRIRKTSICEYLCALIFAIVIIVFLIRFLCS